MIEKRLFMALLSKLDRGGLRVRFWDGDEAGFGPDKPSVTITVRTPAVLRAMARNVTLGFGESYMNGDIEVEGDLVNVMRMADENRAVFAKFSRLRLPHRRNANRRSKQRRLIAHHYDLGNDFYKLWLDTSLTYSCAYFKTAADTLEQAQIQKVDHILRKLQLKPGQHLLDIGSGWGQLLITAAQTYGVTGLGVTLSQEQFELSNRRIKELGLDGKVRVELANYQDLPARTERFDRIVSVGMYEHVGQGNHRHYFDAVAKLLKPKGLTVLHTITTEADGPTDPWIDKYIFPGGYLPTVARTTAFLVQDGFELQDYENLRFHYALTLEEWRRRFHAHRKEVIKMYDERFYRMWDLYLAGSISGFRSSNLTLSQFVMTKGPNAELPLTREHLYRS